MISKPKEWVTALREGWKEVIAEMKKVTWPGGNEVLSTTIVVLIATVVFAVYLWGCDVVFYRAIDFLFSKFGASVSS
ncbi:MAG TPA: preprotein translocase subunit SecE [Thermoanaerobaculia bacterium]|nr:preprotein translocase subunit SecE [Thermoanaerobaculia bacterium]